MSKLKQLKGTLTGTFLLLFSLLLVSCSSVPNNNKIETSDSLSTPIENNRTVNYEENKRIIISDRFKIEFKETCLKKDIDDKDSWFIYAKITNLGEESFLPEDIWNTHIRFSEMKDGMDSLYQNVLPKKDLDGSDFKTAVDNMSKELESEESVIVGSLYNFPLKKKVYLSVYDDMMNLVYFNQFKVE